MLRRSVSGIIIFALLIVSGAKICRAAIGFGPGGGSGGITSISTFTAGANSFIWNTPNYQEFANFNVATGTFQSGVFDLGLSSGNCVQVGSNFQLTTTTNPCGAGGGLTVTGTPQVNYEVVWNGSAAVWTAEGVSYSFAIASFSDGLSSPIEEGSGVWKSSGSITFTASYTNGPPIGSTITYSGWSALPLSSPFTSTTSIANVNYPAVGGSVVFTLTAQKDITVNATITHVFDNDRYWGVDSITGVYTSTDITVGLGNSDLANSIPKTFTVNPGAGQYIVYAYPSRLGTATFTVNGFSGGFQPAQTVSVTNGSGYTENFSVYRSVNANLGSTTVVVTTP